MSLNAQRTKNFMTEFGLDALIATSPVNVAYITGFDCHFYHMFKEYMVGLSGSNAPLRSFGLLLDNLETNLVTMAEDVSYAQGLKIGRIIPYSESIVRINDSTRTPRNSELRRFLELYRQNDLAKESIQALTSAMKENNLEKARIGIEYDTMDQESIARIKKELPDAKIGNATEVLRLIRMIKSNEEIAKMKEAADVNEKALFECMEALRPGISWGKIKRVYLESIARSGAYPIQFLYATNGYSITEYDRQVVKKGDIGFIDLVCKKDLYYSDTGATFFLDRKAPDALKTYQNLKNQLDDAAEHLRPGVLSMDVLDAIKHYAERNGLLFLQHGHSLGREPREYPIIMNLAYGNIADDFVNMSSNMPLERNMIVNIETPYYEMDLGSFIIENTYLITKNGNRHLTRQHRDTPFRA